MNWRTCKPVLHRSLAFLVVFAASSGYAQQKPPPPKELAGNEKVAEIMRTFAPRGVQSDGSQPTPAPKTLELFQTRAGFKIELVANEPAISQPLFLSWDSRGRMWVVQYRQYQYPAGLKVIRFDQHLRAVFDKTPEAPPNHVPGKDRITVFTDTDGDGTYDHHQDVLSGLNIVSSLAVGRGGIWVLNPPYLLFYPDNDGDSVPDADPVVHLSGFGLQDTHSVANSLMWGPDGWLYGANGSTTGGTVSSQATSGISFQGQCIWRYNPANSIFEIYAEGGGNTFSLDIDAEGRVFSGTNGGNTRGWYYPQGSYSRKNWGKHGPLTNPFAFGFFEAMPLEGDTRRFAQAFTIYDSDLFPEEFRGSIIAPNAMQNLVWHSRKLANGSSYRTIDEPNLVNSGDRWFRPVYAGVGPDGAVYIADWYDTRLSHVSPTDDWHKESGRIYRVLPEQSEARFPIADLSKQTFQELVSHFESKNKWLRQRSALELGWRGLNKAEVDLLSQLALKGTYLEPLWALSIAGQFSSELAGELLGSANPHVRRWSVRLLGDRHESHTGLLTLAQREPDVQVRSQLASTARRVAPRLGLSIAAELLSYTDDRTDPHMPLLIWWAIEEHADQWQAMEAFLERPDIWDSPIMREVIAERLMQRYAAEGDAESMLHLEAILDFAPQDYRPQLFSGLNQAFQGRPIPKLPDGLNAQFRLYRESLGNAGLPLAIRQGDASKLGAALRLLNSVRTELGLRIELARALGKSRKQEAQSVLLNLAVGRNVSPALRRVAIQELVHFEDEQIAQRIARAFDGEISAEHDLRATGCRLLASRASWAKVLLQQLDQWRLRPSDIPPDVLQRLRTYSDQDISSLVEQHFGSPPQISSPQMASEIQRLTEIIEAYEPSESSAEEALAMGRQIYQKQCGVCHKLFGEGQKIGPALDNYDRKNLKFWLPAIVGPSLEIREGYQSYAALTEDDRIVTGMIAAQDAQRVTLRTAENRLVPLAREELVELRALPTSLMPSDILKPLTDEQLGALFHYLKQD